MGGGGRGRGRLTLAAPRPGGSGGFFLRRRRLLPQNGYLPAAAVPPSPRCGRRPLLPAGRPGAAGEEGVAAVFGPERCAPRRGSLSGAGEAAVPG